MTPRGKRQSGVSTNSHINGIECAAAQQCRRGPSGTPSRVVQPTVGSVQRWVVRRWLPHFGAASAMLPVGRAGMNRTVERPRLWGIDVVAAIYAIATLLLIYVILDGSNVGRISGAILAPLCALLAIGIFVRFNPVRILLLVLLGVALLGNGLFILFYLSAAFDFVASPPNKEPLEELVRLPFRIAATLTMFIYLRWPPCAGPRSGLYKG